MKFKNIGGIFRMKDKKGNWTMIKHNQIFEAKEEDIPEAFKDLIIPVERKRKAPKEEKVQEKPTVEESKNPDKKDK